MKISRSVMVAPLMASLLILQNCGPKGDGCEDHDPVNTYYHISVSDKSKIPFTGTDTLVYISTDGDTATLYGQGKKEFTKKVAEKWDKDPGCSSYDYNYFDHISLIYQGNNPNLNYIFIDFYANVYGPDADLNFNSLHRTVNFEALNNVSLYKDSVIVSQIRYSGIKVSIDSNSFYLYNYEFGLLQISVLNKIWTQSRP